MNTVSFYQTTTISGVVYELNASITTRSGATDTWQYIKFSEVNSKASMGGLFRFKIGPSAAIGPTWTNMVTSFAFVNGIPSTQSFSTYAGGTEPLTFFSAGLPSQVTLNASTRVLAYNGFNQVTTVAGGRITATNSVGSSTSPFFSTIIALGAHAPVWASTTLISVAQGNTYDLHIICSDQDVGDSITFTALTSLPIGVNLNQNTGVITVASNTIVGAYSLSIRATDLTGRTADKINLTLSVTPASAQPTWSGSLPLSFNFTPGVSSSINLSQYVTNWNANQWVIQLANASDTSPGSASDFLPKGVMIELDGTLTYDGLGVTSSDANIAFKINPIQQDIGQRIAIRGVSQAFRFNSSADLGGVDGDVVGRNYTGFPSPSPVLDTIAPTGSLGSLKFSSDVSSPKTNRSVVIGTGDGVTKTFTGNLSTFLSDNTTQSGLCGRFNGGGLGVTVTTTIGGVQHQTLDTVIVPNGYNHLSVPLSGPGGVTGTVGMNYPNPQPISITYVTPPDNGASITVSYQLGNGTSGYWWCHFDSTRSFRPVDGDAYFMQTRIRFDQNRIWQGGHKWFLESWSDEPGTTPSNSVNTVAPCRTMRKTACQVNEIVGQTGDVPKHFTEMYTACPGSGFFDRNGASQVGSLPFRTTIGGQLALQTGPGTQMAPFCLYNMFAQNPPYSSTACLNWQPNEWMTVLYGVHLGQYVAHSSPLNACAPGCFAQSRIRLWIMRDPAVVGQGHPLTLVNSSTLAFDTYQDIASLELGKYYHDSRTTTPPIYPNNEWRSDIILSRYPIAAPS